MGEHRSQQGAEITEEETSLPHHTVQNQDHQTRPQPFLQSDIRDRAAEGGHEGRERGVHGDGPGQALRCGGDRQDQHHTEGGQADCGGPGQVLSPQSYHPDQEGEENILINDLTLGYQT